MWRHEDSWIFLEEGMTEKGCSAAGRDVLLQDGRRGSGWVWEGQLWQQCTGCTGRGKGARWDPALAPWPRLCSFHLPWGWAEHALRCCAVPPSSAQENQRKQVFQGGDPIYMHLMLELYRNKLDSLISWLQIFLLLTERVIAVTRIKLIA